MGKQFVALLAIVSITAAMLLLVYAKRERRLCPQCETVCIGWSHRGALGYGHIEVNLKTGLVSVPTVPASYTPWPPGWSNRATASEIQALRQAVESAELCSFTPDGEGSARHSGRSAKSGGERTGSILFIEGETKRKVFLLPQEMSFPVEELQFASYIPKEAQKYYEQMNRIMKTMVAIVSRLDPEMNKTDRTCQKGDMLKREKEYNVVRGRIETLWHEAMPVADGSVKAKGRKE